MAADYTWATFKAAVDTLLITNANRAGTENAKDLQVKLGAKRLQDCVHRYRTGHQDTYEFGDLSPNGFASEGELPEAAEIQDAFMVGSINRAVTNTADLTDDELTVTAHGITAATTTEEVSIGHFINSGGVIHGGLSANQSYFLRVVDADTITVHLSAQDALDDVDPVDITADGTGATTLRWGERRYHLDWFPWAGRHELIAATVAMTGSKGFITINPNELSFIAFPQVPSGEDDNNRTWRIEVNWDGVKLDFEDADETPFDDEAVSGVAEHVNSWFARVIDSDLNLAVAAEKTHRAIKAGAYLKSKRMKETKG